MNRDALQISQKIRDFEGSPDEAFYILQAMGKLVGEYGMRDNAVVEAAILLKSKANEFAACQDIFIDVIDEIMRHSGLYPYITNRDETFKDSLFYEINSHPENEDFIFHNLQSKIFWDLVDGKNLIVSAPTSFGKSAVIDPLISHKKLNKVLIIVPTISLLDETRKRLQNLFGETYQIISHKRDSYKEGGPALFIMTQERAVEREDISDLDLLIIDEFYKLDPNKDGGERYRTLNRALYKYGQMARQVYLLGPNIDYNQTEMLGKTFKIYKTDFQTVAVEIIENFGLKKEEKIAKTINILECHPEDSTLIFVSSPQQANKLALELISKIEIKSSSVAEAWGKELAENVHPEWIAAKALSHGIALHHGRLPRSISQLGVKLFNSEKIKVLICTSSLIEGVNTVAKNIIIHHNRINNKKHDFFTFSNIKGRAGRMLQHYVGRVYLFEEAPEPVNVEVEIPIVDSKLIEDESFLFDVDLKDLSPSQRLQVQSTCEKFEVSESCISKLADYNIRTDEEISFFKERLEVYVEDPIGINWDSPKYQQLKLAYDFIWDYMNFSRKGSSAGLRSSSQATRVTFNLLKSESIYSFLNEYTNSVPQYIPTKGEAIETGFQFLRAAEFTLPSALMDLSYFINTLTKRTNVEYSLFALSLESWFIKSTVLALEENGIPYFVSEEYKDVLNDDLDISWNMKEMFSAMTENNYFDREEYKFLKIGFPSRLF